MKPWINVNSLDLLDSGRLRRFILPRRHVSKLASAVAAELTPDALATMLRSIIAEARPDLKDAGVFAVSFNMGWSAFEALLWHPSFDAVACGVEIPAEYLYADGDTWRTRPPML